jgi:hypothetical protein
MTSQTEALLFYGALCGAVLITRIPHVGKFFRVINTMFHETGHALAAIATSGSVLKVELFSDLSGLAKTTSGGWFSRVFVSLAGYMFASAIAWLFFFLMNTGLYTIALWIMLGTGILNLIFFVRNSYGIFWLLCFSTLTGVTIYYNNALAQKLYVTAFSMLLLGDSVISAFELFIIALRKPKEAGDARNLKEVTKLPTIVWALLFVCFSVFVLWDIVIRFFPSLSLIYK